MKTWLHQAKVASLLLVLFLLFLPFRAWSSALPLQKVLTVRLSTLSADGNLTQVAETTAKTDSECKLTFGFPTVPSSAVSPFLYIQILDGTTVLRQSISPSPEANGNVDIGISEVTDLQAIAILKAATISGKLTHLHLLVAQTLVRTPYVTPVDAERTGAAIAAGADALYNVISAEGLSSAWMATFFNSVAKGLRDSSSLYRKSIDNAIQFDPKVEAYSRGEAFDTLMYSLITAGADAGILLEVIETAFASSAAAAETLLEVTQGFDPKVRALMRLCLVYGIIDLSNYRIVQEHLRSFSFVGVAPPKFTQYFDTQILLSDKTTQMQKSMDGYWLAVYPFPDIQLIQGFEYNSLANRDLLMWKVGMELYNASRDQTGEYSSSMLSITTSMASLGGIMTGMTPSKLLGILGKYIPDPPSTPSLLTSEIAAWSFVERTPAFKYTPIAGLVDQLINKPIAIPAFDQLLEPYKSLAFLEYDLSLVSILKAEKQAAAEDAYLADPQNPQRWIPMATVYQLSQNHRQRLAAIRQNISGVTYDTKEAYMRLLKPFATL